MGLASDDDRDGPFLRVIAWAAIRLIVGGREPVREPSEVSAREILDARLARGEIDGTEFEATRRLLEAEAVAPAGGRVLRLPA